MADKMSGGDYDGDKVVPAGSFSLSVLALIVAPSAHCLLFALDLTPAHAPPLARSRSLAQVIAIWDPELVGGFEPCAPIEYSEVGPAGPCQRDALGGTKFEDLYPGDHGPRGWDWLAQARAAPSPRLTPLRLTSRIAADGRGWRPITVVIG
jgi:hypothetical protein